MSRPHVLALIPARGGSKGIPRKNLIELAGQPLISYSIQQALASAHITRVLVSTDDEDIARVSRSWGAETPFIRPPELAQDLSPDIDTFRHVLAWLATHEGYEPELVVHLRPTGPVRRVELVDEAIERMLNQPEADALRSVSWPVQTPYKMWRIDARGLLQPLLSIPQHVDPQSMPRQLLPEVYWQNGYVDIVRPATVLGKSSMRGDHVLPFVVNEPIYEIDYHESLAVVEAAIHRMRLGLPLEMPDDALPRHPV